MLTPAVGPQRVSVPPVDPAAAEEFVRTFHEAHPEAGPVEARLAQVRAEIAGTGTYWHTREELAYGARVALRDSGWCTNVLPWRRLTIRDLRGVRDARAVAGECVEHLRIATGGGQIRPLVSVFAPDIPGAPGPCVWNEQLVCYAGYRDAAGRVLGDGRYTALTETVRRMGWQPPAQRSAFDLLPLVVETAQEGPRRFCVPRDVVQQVPLEHPELPWFVQLGLRWHTVPVVSHMKLVIGGVTYPAAPFNRWFVGSEIGSRSLADEAAYGLAREVAERLGLDTSTERTLWRDRATVEINRAVLHSFDAAQVTITDHYAEAMHRLAWLRSRRPGLRRPAFRLDPESAQRSRFGGPPRFGVPPQRPEELTEPSGRLVLLSSRRAGAGRAS